MIGIAVQAMPHLEDEDRDLVLVEIHNSRTECLKEIRVRNRICKSLVRERLVFWRELDVLDGEYIDDTGKAKLSFEVLRELIVHDSFDTVFSDSMLTAIQHLGKQMFYAGALAATQSKFRLGTKEELSEEAIMPAWTIDEQEKSKKRHPKKIGIALLQFSGTGEDEGPLVVAEVFDSKSECLKSIRQRNAEPGERIKLVYWFGFPKRVGNDLLGERAITAFSVLQALCHRDSQKADSFDAFPGALEHMAKKIFDAGVRHGRKSEARASDNLSSK